MKRQAGEDAMHAAHLAVEVLPSRLPPEARPSALLGRLWGPAQVRRGSVRGRQS